MIKHIELIVGAYFADIVYFAIKKAKNKYYSNSDLLPPGDWEDHEMNLCRMAIPYLESHGHLDKPLVEQKRLLITHFSYYISELIGSAADKREVRNRKEYGVRNSLYPAQSEEDILRAVDLQIIREFIAQAPDDISTYCKLMMVHETKEAVREKMGYSKGGFYRLEMRVKKHFFLRGKMLGHSSD